MPIGMTLLKSLKLLQKNIVSSMTLKTDDLIDKFLNNVQFKFVPTEEVLVKCGFSAENYQPAAYSSGIPIISENY